VALWLDPWLPTEPTWTAIVINRTSTMIQRAVHPVVRPFGRRPLMRSGPEAEAQETAGASRLPLLRGFLFVALLLASALALAAGTPMRSYTLPVLARGDCRPTSSLLRRRDAWRPVARQLFPFREAVSCCGNGEGVRQ